MDKNYIEYQTDCTRLLTTSLDNLIAKKIIKLSWEVSFDKKDERMKKIIHFINTNSLKTVKIEQIDYDTLELIISLNHFRRSKF
ncbi:MAG: hypothetical protein GY756_11955 [bacterium]|nr:hypothetical protein [bacterium]